MRTIRSLWTRETLAELVMVIAVIGILAVMAVPAFLSDYQAAALKSGAPQVVAMINQVSAPPWNRWCD